MWTSTATAIQTSQGLSASVGGSDAPKGRVRELDGLRGLAILLVLVWHYVVVPASFSPHSLFARRVLMGLNLTWSGVDLFFVLSGYLIGGILLDVRESSNYYRTFYGRRFFRIVPIYTAVLLAFWIARSWLPARYEALWLTDQAIPWYSYATLTQNFWMAAHNSFGAGWLAATWSLAVEEQFYLTLPFAVRLLRPTRLKPILLMAMVAAPLLRVALYLMFPNAPWATFVLAPCRADALLIGVMAAMLVRDPHAMDYLRSRRLFLPACIVVLGAGIPCLSYMSRGGMFLSLTLVSVGYTWLALFYAGLLLLAVTRQDLPLVSALRAPWLVWLGTVSYGVYLLHEPVRGLLLCALVDRIPEMTSLFAALLRLSALALTLLIAALSWSYFERPLLAVGHSLKYRFS